MAIYIEITKISEDKDIGFYRIFTKHGGNTEFYVGINKKIRKIYCFLTSQFSLPVRIIDLNDPNEVAGEIPGAKVQASIIAKVFRAARKIFELNEFPDCLDYCA